MGSGFDAGELCSEASLNRTLVWGRPAFDLLGADAVAGMVGDAAADEVGRRLAALIATLRTGDIASGLGLTPTPWRRAYLAHWQTISHVWLGGGTTARFGSPLAEVATRHLAGLGVSDVMVEVTDHPAMLALVGAARSAVTRASSAAVFDLGHTLVKRGIAEYAGSDKLTAIKLGAAVPLDARAMTAGEVLDAVRDVVGSTLAGNDRVDSVVLSVAAYVRDGEPVNDGRGAYGVLRSVDLPRPSTWVHDGTAAARAVASTPDAAVIMLGTAIGVGFPPAAGNVRPVAADFSMA